MTNSWIRWSQHSIDSGSIYGRVKSVEKSVGKHSSPSCSLLRLNDHRSKCSTQLELIWGQVPGCWCGKGGGVEGERGRGGGCWRLSWQCKAVAWGSCPQRVTWHILQPVERIIAQAHLSALFMPLSYIDQGVWDSHCMGATDWERELGLRVVNVCMPTWKYACLCTFSRPMSTVTSFVVYTL